jgi:protein-disulfide isomerase
LTPDEAPEVSQESADVNRAAHALKPPPPVWSYFLTPLAVVIGSVIIAGAIWWTADDGKARVIAAPATAAESTVPAGAPVSTVQTLLDAFNAYAKQIGLDLAKFQGCLAKQDITLVNAQFQRGNTLGVNGTPTFFINNKKLVGAQPAAIFDEIVAAELKGSPQTLDGYSPAVKQLAASQPPYFEIIPAKPDVSDANVEGNPKAKVIVAEFSDFQCPFCKRWTDDNIKRVRAELGNDVAFAFLHFPIGQIHPNAAYASLAAVCASDQGKFWQMHDVLFARQDEWASLKAN